MSHTNNTMDSRAILRMDMGFCMGIVLEPLLACVYGLHVFSAYQLPVRKHGPELLMYIRSLTRMSRGQGLYFWGGERNQRS